MARKAPVRFRIEMVGHGPVGRETALYNQKGGFAPEVVEYRGTLYDWHPAGRLGSWIERANSAAAYAKFIERRTNESLRAAGHGSDSVTVTATPVAVAKKNPTRRVWKVEFHPAVGQTARLRQIVDRWDGKLNTTTYVATFAAADDAENATEQAANWGIAGRDTRVAKPKVVLVRRNPKTKSRARRDFERADRAYRSVASGRRSHIEFRDMLGPQTRDSEGHWKAREVDDVRRGARTQPRAVSLARELASLRANPAYYGAPMGYRTTAPTSTTLLVRRVKIDRGGYAPDGAYFGIGKPVYVATDADSGDVVETLRAYDHASAKDKVRAKYPNMKVK